MGAVVVINASSRVVVVFIFVPAKWEIDMMQVGDREGYQRRVRIWGEKGRDTHGLILAVLIFSAMVLVSVAGLTD